MTSPSPNSDDASSVSGQRRQAEFLLSMGILIFFGAYFFTIAYRYSDMFLLIEYRQWAFHAPQVPLLTAHPFSDLLNLAVDTSQFNIAFSRSTSFWIADLFGDVCGTAPSCHNGAHFFILIVAVALLVLSTRALSVSASWFPATVTGVVVALSVPMMDAITWQATLLDQTAMLLSAVTILIASRLKLDSTSLSRILYVNFALFVPMFFAYNAKEQAFFLAPATLLLLLLRTLIISPTLVGAVRRVLAFAVLPATYACLHVAIVYYNRTFLQPGEMSRVTGGNLAFNVEFYSRYILNMLGGHWTVHDLQWAALGIGGLVMIGIVLDITGTARRHIPITLFPLLALAGSLYITIRTSSTSPFYLLVSMAYFGLLVGLSLDSVLARLRSVPLRLSFACACTTVLFMRVITLQDALPGFDHLHALSSNFQRTLDVVRAEIPRAPFSRIVFVRPFDEPRTYMYASSPADGGDYALAPYLALPDTSMLDLLALDAKIKDIPATEASTATRSGDLVVTLGPDLSLVGMSHQR